MHDMVELQELLLDLLNDAEQSDISHDDIIASLEIVLESAKERKAERTAKDER